MKLSEAMMLGATITPEKRIFDLGSCALGVAANAVGIQQGANRARNLSKTWPWLTEHAKDGNPWTSYGSRITMIFNREVCYYRRQTLASLIEYIKSVEPDCGECNRFECTCKPVELEVHAMEMEVK